MGAALAAPVARPDKKPERASPASTPDEEQQDSTQAPEAGVPRYLAPGNNGSNGNAAPTASEQHARNAAQCIDPNANPMQQASARSGDELAAVEEEQADADKARASQRDNASAGGEEAVEEAPPEIENKTDAKQAGGSDGSGGSDGGGDAGAGGEGGGGAGADGGGGAEGASPEGADGGAGESGGGGGSSPGDAGAGGAGEATQASDGGAAAAGSSASNSDLAALGTGDLALIDTELAEHQRWGQAAAHVGAAGSADRAAFVAETVGSGLITGAASGFGTGLAIGLAARAVPVLGPILGGGMALHGLISGWGATTEAVGKFGEGNSIYETLANSIEAISAIVNVVNGVLNIINSIVSIVQMAAMAVAAGGAIATVLTLGAAAPIAIAAGELAATCLEISEGLTIVTTALDAVNNFVLMPSAVLFRALHSFTSQADPRDVEASGQQLSGAASNAGGALGGWLGGKAAHIGAGGPKVPPREDTPPPAHETPPPAGEGPAVHFDEPLAGKQSPGAPAPGEVPAVPGVDPHGPTVPAPAPVDPHAPTIPAPAPVDPHAPTIPAPAPVDPHAPTMPAPGPVDPHTPTMPVPADPHAPTQPAPAPVDPHGPTMPAPEPVDPHAPTALPDQGPGGMSEIPKPGKVPEFENPGFGDEPDFRSPSRAPTELAPAASDVDPHGSTMPAAPDTVDPRAPTALPDQGPGGMPEIPKPAKVPEFENPGFGDEPDFRSPSRAPTDPAPADVPGTTPSTAPTEPAPQRPAPRRITDETAAAAPKPAEAETATAAPQATAADAEPAPQYGPIDERSFASLQPEVDAVANSPLGDRMASQAMAPMQDVPRDTARSKQGVHDAAYADIKNNRPAGHGASNLDDQHWMKVKDATIKAAAGTDPAAVSAINENRSVLNSDGDMPSTLLLTTEGVPASELPTGDRGTRFFMGDEPMGRPAVPAGAAGPDSPAIPAEPGAVGGPARPEGSKRNSTEHKFADQRLIPGEAAKIQEARARAGLPPLDDVQLAKAAGEQARWRMEGVPSTDLQQNPTKPWSGELITRPTEPMQLDLKPKDPVERAAWNRNMRQRAAAAPDAPEVPAAPPPAVPEGQMGFNFDEPAKPTAAAPASDVAPPAPAAPATPEVPQARPVTPDDVAAQATRSQRPLTPQEYADYRARLIAKGVPPEQIAPGEFTAFHPDGKGGGHITIGPDVNPLPEGQRPIGLLNPANAHVDAESALSHESIGHREAELAGQAYADDPQMEEAQASARAAVLDPDLTPRQREILMKDSAARLQGRDNDDNVYMYMERYEAPEKRSAPRDDTPAAGAPRTPDQFRPQDQLPSVIVDPALLAPPDPATPRPGEAPAAQALPGTAGARASAPQVNANAAGALPARGALPSSANSGRVAAQDAAAARQGAAPGTGNEKPGVGTRLLQAAEMFRPHLFGIGDPEAPSAEQQDATRRAQFTADNQPAKGVERVNPKYPSPPGTPAQLEAMQHEISRLLAERAQAEEEAQRQDGRAQQCEANQGPVQQTLDDTTQGISAAQAHAQSVAAHDAANRAQQQRQTEAQGLVAGYPGRATGLAALTVPLAAWAGFTSLASHLPGDAGTKMQQMNQDATKMQDAFADMGAQMVGLDSQQPARQAELEGDSTRLDATASQAQGSDQDLRKAQAGAQGLQQANNAAQSEAEQLKADATKQAQQKDEAATKKQGEAKTLSEQMQAWATAHKAARQEAIAATQKRLEAEGKLNVKVSANG